MSTVKLNLTLDEALAAFLRERAARVRKPTERYVAELIEADRKRYEDELAEEGYRLLSADTASFANAALPLANEAWSKWEPEHGE